MKFSFVMGFQFLGIAQATLYAIYFIIAVYPLIVRPSFDLSFTELKYFCTNFLI